ncbi:MAG: antibiotic biosynthesis monooxygenase family protein [Caldilineaceae bacterium]
MLPSIIPPQPERLYRIDKFNVPAPAHAEFLEKVQLTHELLRTLPGFIQDLVFEQSDGPGQFNFVTLVVWENRAALEAARAVVLAKHRESGFSPSETFERLHIVADVAIYSQIEVKNATH